jgi:hypothetical protein
MNIALLTVRYPMVSDLIDFFVLSVSAFIPVNLHFLMIANFLVAKQ